MNDKVRMFGVDIDAVDMKQAVRIIDGWIRAYAGRCRYVVTPNVNHVVKLSTDEAFVEAYRHATLVLADGKPVVLAARLLGMPLPGTVPGSDLVPALFEHAQNHGRALRVFLLGAAPGVGERAAAAIEAKWPHVSVVGTMSPPQGFEHSHVECDRICLRVTECRPDVLVVGLGAPKQELWVRRHHHRLQAKAALCVGATIDFLAGEKPRAPRFLRAVGLEWAHRMLSEPRRLAGRYARDALAFPRLFLLEWASRR